MFLISTQLKLGGETYRARPIVGEAAARILRDYLIGDAGASAAEYAILLFVLCGCVIFGIHSLGRHSSRAILRVARAIGGHPAP